MNAGLVWELIVFGLVAKKACELARDWLLEERLGREVWSPPPPAPPPPCAEEAETARARQAKVERRVARANALRISELTIIRQVIEEELAVYAIGPLHFHTEAFAGDDRIVLIIEGPGWVERWRIYALDDFTWEFDRPGAMGRFEESVRECCRHIVHKYVLFDSGAVSS